MPQAHGNTLRTFLADPSRPPDALTYHELQGFLFAVASAPELVKPFEWMPIVFGEQEARYSSLEEAQAVIGELMGLYNSVNAAVFEKRAALPGDCKFRRQPLANLDDDAPVAQWSRGFLRGHQWLQESWDAYVPDEIDDDYAAMLMALSFFASKKLAEEYCDEAGGRDLREMATSIRRVFPSALAGYAHLGRSIPQVVAEVKRSEPRGPQRRKTGRN